MFERFRKHMPKQKSKEELDKHYEHMNLEKGDLSAMLIAALITFGPVLLVMIFLLIVIGKFFGM